MPKPTKKSLLTAALTVRGYVPDAATRVTRYDVFKPTETTRMVLKPQPELDILDHRIYIGKNGAARFARSGRVSDSVTFNPCVLALLVEEVNHGT